MNAFRSTLMVLAVLPTLVAHAGDLDEARRVTVSYADLNLRKPAGARRLYQRIHAAATSVCRNFDTKELSDRPIWKQCVSDAVSRAVLDVDSPLLTAHYAAKKSKNPEQVALAAGE